MLRRFVTALLLVSFSIASISAQQTKRNPEEQPRKVKQEPKKAYANWISDVDPILTQSERDAWKKLATDDEREKFIEDFWHSRDPDPDTEENEFKQEFFERIAGRRFVRSTVLRRRRIDVHLSVGDVYYRALIIASRMNCST
jgi:hypothetical protein